MSPVAEEYGSDDCVSPTVTRNQLIPVKLLYEDGCNLSKNESVQIPLSATVATSTYPCVEEFQQSSPVSVLDDAVFEDEEEEEEEEEDDEEEGASTMGSRLDCFEGKMHAIFSFYFSFNWCAAGRIETCSPYVSIYLGRSSLTCLLFCLLCLQKPNNTG